MDTEIKAGNVVRLKSGGPDMTVQQVTQPDLQERQTASCVWFQDGKAQYHTLPVAALELVKTDTSDAYLIKTGPLPSEAFRLKLMDVAAELCTDSDDFFKVYFDLLFKARRSLSLGALAFLSDQDIRQMGDLHPSQSSTQSHVHQPQGNDSDSPA